jgi:pimeloyl-ACP methyl ester carboxylesterase
MAYRTLGRSVGIPLLMLIHFRGNMDIWDPILINRLAESRPIILIDSPGTGRSDGPVPETYPGWADFAAGIVKHLGHEKVDVLGWSMSGLVAESFAIYHPELTRKLLLVGTTSPMNVSRSCPQTLVLPLTVSQPEFVPGELPYFIELAGADTEESYKLAHEHTFWPPTPKGHTDADQSWDRIMSRREDDRQPVLSAEAAKAQTASWMNWLADKTLWEKLKALSIPVFIANGNDDLLTPTVNSYVMMRNIKNAYLHIYPEAGHAFLYQHYELFSKHVDLFLDREY